LQDRKVIQVRLEAFNALNQANFADPVKFLSSAVFGQSTSMLNLMLGTGSPGSGLSPILQTGGPRSLQGTVRFRFDSVINSGKLGKHSPPTPIAMRQNALGVFLVL